MSRNAFQLAKGVHLPGTKWLLVREIARGGMGVTWEVVKHPGIRGVMKMILPDLAARSSYVRRFLEEVEILTKLNHPNIVQVFDFDTLEDGTPFFVMERLEGKTLGAAMIGTKGGVRVRKAFPARVAYEITRQTCEALYRAHSLQPKGVIHRDLKPENIYIHHASFGGEPVIKLLDFGVAAFEQAARESGPVGTPRYMAPEQLRCEEITPKADLYAMGLVLYEMLVGRGPFDDLANAAHPNDRPLVLANAHLSETPPPPSRFAPWIPQTIDSLLLSALDKDPERRPVSAYALVAKLFELQFVNDGTPREAVDANTTAPTLVKIIEDDEETEEPRREAVPTVRDRAALQHETVRTVGAPPVPPSNTIEMPADPFGRTAPKAQQQPKAHAAIDREAATRFRNTAPHRRPPQNDTVPMVPSVPRRTEGSMRAQSAARAPSPAPARPEATPLTSEIPMRAAPERGGRERTLSRTASERSRRWRILGLRLVAVFVVAPAISAGLVFGVRRVQRPVGAEANLHEAPSAVVVAATANATLAPTAPTSPPSTVQPGSLPSLLPAESPAPPPLVSVSPEPTVSAAIVAATTAPVATASAVRAKVPPAKPPTAKPASSRPSAGAVADDGRDLLYVPPRQP